MHSKAECKASSRCRNCGGPHRSFSRDCQARPNKLGPVEKKLLEAIHRSEHLLYAKTALAKVAAKREEEAIIASNRHVFMVEGSDYGVLESEEEV